jgi:hypothetical protein
MAWSTTSADHRTASAAPGSLPGGGTSGIQNAYLSYQGIAMRTQVAF